jgi:hypothetical protein
VNGNQLLVGAGAPEGIAVDHTVRNNGPYTPTDIIEVTSVGDVDADSDSSLDCAVAPNHAGSTTTLPIGLDSSGSTPFTVEWQDASPPPSSCSLQFLHATQVTTPTARDLNATETLLNETDPGVNLVTNGAATAAWTGVDASLGTDSVQLSFSAGAGNSAEARVTAGIPLSSILDLQFDYQHVAGGALPSTDLLAPGVSIEIDCDSDGLTDESILSSQIITGTGDPVAGQPGWSRVDLVDTANDSWYVPGIVPSGSPATLANAVSAITVANASCGSTDTITFISLQYGDATASAGTTRVDNLFFSGAERTLLTLDLVLDTDGDGIADGYQTITDNCPTTANPAQVDTNNDGEGDVCDPDLDGDGVANGGDNCPSVANASQADFDADTIGDACDDSDGDGVFDDADNCRTTPNPSQLNTDGDPEGDECDSDDDNDAVPDATDSCDTVSEDLDLQSDADGCPDSDVSVSVASQPVTSIDVGATGTFTLNSTITNGNYPADIEVTISVRSVIGVCAGHLIAIAGDSLVETNIDTDFDTIPDTLSSVITATLTSMSTSEGRSAARNYDLTCLQRGTRSVQIDVSASPIAPVVEENSANNAFTESQVFSVYDVADIQATSLTATDALPSRPGTQVMAGPLPPVAGAIAPVGFGVTQTLGNLGPFGPVGVNSPTIVNDVDQDGDSSVDCDFEPNVSGSTVALASGGSFTGNEPLTITWLDGAAPPYFCTATFQKTLSILRHSCGI